MQIRLTLFSVSKELKNDLNVVFMLQVLQPKYPDVPDLCDEPDLVHLHTIWRGPTEPGEKRGGG
jgi:hypothetical protein